MPTTSSPKTVLVIEDDRSISLVIKGHLQRAGFRVVGASSGAEGLTLARTGPVDVITLDVLMQPVDGWAVFQALRSDPVTRNVPVVFVTIVDERPDGLVCEGYVTKPFQGRELLEVVTRALTSAERCPEDPGSDHAGEHESPMTSGTRVTWPVSEAHEEGWQ
jgi:CheY-like chemotaxis protein